MISDLSKNHEPIPNLFLWPTSPEDWNRYRLTKDQIEFFHTNGYLAGIRLLNDEQIAVLRGELTDLINPNHPGHHLFYEFHSNEAIDPATVLFHALGAWRIAPGFHDLLWNPAFLMPASQLLGGAVRFWHDQLFYKPARHGGVVAWHQDYSYWSRTTPVAHLTCWIGLDDSTIENGCLYYVPGSHRWNLLPVTGLAGNMDEIRTVLSDEQKAAFRPVAIELKRGECPFHHPFLLHGSYENRTDQPRRATVINVFRDGVRSAPDKPRWKESPPVPAGRPREGRSCPLRFNPH